MCRAVAVYSLRLLICRTARHHRRQDAATSLRVSIPEKRAPQAQRSSWTSSFDPLLNSLNLELTRLSRGSSSSSVPPFDPLLNSLRELPSTELPIKRQRTAECARAPEAVKLAVGLLEDEFELREAASKAFPPEITSSHIRTSMSKYEDEMSAASMRSVCCSCGRFVAAPHIYEIDDQPDFIRLLQGSSDNCGRHGTWHFCTPCHTVLIRGKTPKFSAKNLVNVTMCQNYPAALEDLMPVEECLKSDRHDPQIAAGGSSISNQLQRAARSYDCHSTRPWTTSPDPP